MWLAGSTSRCYPWPRSPIPVLAGRTPPHLTAKTFVNASHSAKHFSTQPRWNGAQVDSRSSLSTRESGEQPAGDPNVTMSVGCPGELRHRTPPYRPHPLLRPPRELTDWSSHVSSTIRRGLICLAGLGAAPAVAASASPALLKVTSSLDGKTVLPHRRRSVPPLRDRLNVPTTFRRPGRRRHRTVGECHPRDWRLAGPAAKTVSMPPESRPDRRKRVSQRALFDEVADLYDATRQSYPNEIVEVIVRTAELRTGLSVLEIGCGTGQLTRRLAGRGLDITAIDIGPAMVAGAKRNVADPKVAFQVSSFEDFQASRVFDLIVSATAFHWVDPDLGLAKAARTLRPSGWLALSHYGRAVPRAAAVSPAAAVGQIQPGPSKVGLGSAMGRTPTRYRPLRNCGRGDARTAPRIAGPDSPRSGVHSGHLPQLQRRSPTGLRRRPRGASSARADRFARPGDLPSYGPRVGDGPPVAVGLT